ncbi:MAG: hypothetical protein ACI38P_05005, partial [Cellulosimicrobium funkei]
QVPRGDALLTPGAWEVTDVVDVRRLSGAATSDWPSEVRVHVGTAAVTARARPLGDGHARLTFVRALPTGVIDGAGRPGSAALASGDVPGEAELEVTGGQPYSIWAVGRAGSSDGAGLDVEDVTVTCADGDLTVSAPSVSGSSGLGSSQATTVAEVTPPASGTCTVTVAQGAAPAGTTFVVTEGWRFGTFFATLGGTIVLWFVAIGGGLLGAGLLVGGIVWRVIARRA